MHRDEAKLRAYFADAPTDISLESIDQQRLPSHISIIMDGNGRWAQARHMDRAQGHKAGVGSLREIITSCVRLGIEVLSAYAFSTENWQRPQHEVNLLMQLFAKTLIQELPLLRKRMSVLSFWAT